MGDHIVIKNVTYLNGKPHGATITYEDQNIHGGHQDPYPKYYHYEVKPDSIRVEDNYRKHEIILSHIKPIMEIFKGLPELSIEFDVDEEGGVHARTKE